ncbi:MAG: hypothetical protein BJBARM4_0534 [Candidatus Parvarchaeum acidiphilum ARMAN-4]|uniref:Uncharacterized protein n=1 Tax=Candidatus Parvarchaeum acidiphilum ARMAN-4 TaxID=662760 RepID=D2EFL6_PARA4|nr:MAG: hypothetical protein BJBARM4_0534 [Candidatus Parvarchaeum acidiphilum ARMAN-4]
MLKSNENLFKVIDTSNLIITGLAILSVRSQID